MASVSSGECGAVDVAVSACAVYPREIASKIECDSARKKCDADADADADVIVVNASRIIGTRWTVFSAWEPCEAWSHSTVCTIAGRRMGQVGRRRLPAELEALAPFSDERWHAVRAWHEAEYQRAYAAIVAIYPACREGFGGTRGMGEIELSNWLGEH